MKQESIVDDLRKCQQHGIPVNRCVVCWPGYLGYLSSLCVLRLNEAKAGIRNIYGERPRNLEAQNSGVVA